METTKIYEATKEVVEEYNNNSVENDEVAKFIAEDISLAIVKIYGKGATAKYILDTISYHVQAWCNPALEDNSDEDNF